MAAYNRYSRLVSGLKVTLPLLALGILSTLFLLSEQPDPERAIPYAEVDVEQLAREMRLTRPRYAGVLPDGNEITMIAETARPDFDTANVISTASLEGRIELDGDETLFIDALSGQIDMSTRIADLAGDVVAETTAGYRVTSERMYLRLAEPGASIPTDVRVDGPGLTITAREMEYSGLSGAGVLSFTGDVRLLYEPGQ